MKRILAVLSLLFLGSLVSCGGGGGNGGGGQVHVTVSPSSAAVIAGQTQQFSAAVTGALNSGVAWSVTCSTTACGTIDNNGLYTAPSPIPSAITVTVRATSQEDTNIVGTASVTHNPVAVAVSPNSSLIMISADTKQFGATITNAPSGHGTYTWTLSGPGSIDANGLYSAPSLVSTDTTATVTAASDFDISKKSSVTITLKAPVVTLSPGDTTMEAGAQLQLTPTVSYVPTGQNGVTWELTGLGSIAAGLYHAPALVSAHHQATIKVISTFDPTKSAQVVITMDPIVVTVSPKSVTLYPEQTQQFTASVANHVTKSVTWSISGPACGGDACGTIDANGLYTAPSSISDEFTIDVIATSVADPSRSDSALVTLKPITVTVTPKNASVNVNGTQQFSAVVQGGNNLNVTWSLSGTGCSGASCGTISATGLYTAPASVPVPATVTVTATSVADVTRSDTATVTIVLNLNTKLMGTFVFQYTGWDINGKRIEAVGSFVADGVGHLTSGTMDRNTVSGTGDVTYYPFTGTYSVGGDNRGSMTFTLASGDLNFRFSLLSTGDTGYFIRFQSASEYGSGVFKRRTAVSSVLSGNFVVSMIGVSYTGERDGAAGVMSVNSAGTLTSGTIDVAEAGGTTANTVFGGSMLMDNTTGIDRGRGTFAVSVTGVSGGPRHFAYYALSADEAWLISSDYVNMDVPLFRGKMVRQTGTFNNASFAGNSVFYMSGVSGADSHSVVQIGQYYMNNDGTGHADYARNIPGQQIVNGGTQSITYSIASNGRGLYSSPSFPTCVFYLSSPRTGVVMQYDSPGTSVMFGYFEPQSSETFQDSSLVGNYAGGTLVADSLADGFSSGVQHWDGLGNWTGTGDLAATSIGNVADQVVAGTYVTVDSTHGRGSWTLSSPGVYQKAFYMVSSDKMLFISLEPGTSNPTVEIMEQ